MENVYHVEKSSPWSVANLQVMAEALMDWWKDNFVSISPLTVAIERIDSRDLTVEAAPFHSLPCLTGCTGTGTSPQLPNNVTVAVKWTGGLTGRSQRGRTYHVGLTEAQVEGDAVSVVSGAVILASYQAILSAISTAILGAKLVIVSYISGGVPRTVGQTTDVLTGSLDLTIDSQRRRLAGRGS